MTRKILKPQVDQWVPQAAVAVLGGAVAFTDGQLRASFVVGQGIAAHRKILITGATTGVPLAAALGAHAAGGFVVGVSPARDATEHVQLYGKALRQADLLLFTGMGLDGRSPMIVRSARGAIFIGGEFGTLGEFCCGWQSTSPKVLGILEGAGGLTEEVQRLVALTTTAWRSELVSSPDPRALVERVCARVDQLRMELPADPESDLEKKLLDVLGEGVSNS